MRTRNIFLVILILSTSLLASCSSSVNWPQNGSPNGYSGPSNSNAQTGVMPGGGRGRGPRSGSGGRFGSGARSGSWGNSIMSQLSPADQTVFTQMMTARRNGDTQTSDQLQAQLQQKYPNLQFNFNRRSSTGSGSQSGSGTTSSGSSN